MIKRIVKMTFKPDLTDSFIAIYSRNWEKIRTFPGCHHVELLRDRANPSVFFTYSHWESEIALNNYRNSDLFIAVWGSVKPLFDAKAAAWSLEALEFPPVI